MLERHGISCILNVADEVHSDTASLYVSSYHHLKWTHTQSNLARREFHRAIRILETAHRDKMNVLVHCQSGVERSASLVIAYILHLSRNNNNSNNEQILSNLTTTKTTGLSPPGLLEKKLTLSEAYDFVRIRAPAIKPNMELMYQLNEFELLAFPKKTIMVRARSNSMHHNNHCHQHYQFNHHNHHAAQATSPKISQHQRPRRRAASSASSTLHQYRRGYSHAIHQHNNSCDKIQEHNQQQQLLSSTSSNDTPGLTVEDCSPCLPLSSTTSNIIIPTTTKTTPTFPPDDELHILLIVMVAIFHIIMVTRHSNNGICQQQIILSRPSTQTKAGGGSNGEGRPLERRTSWIGESPSTPFSPLFLHRLFPIY
ncbi:protein-tyrosine phosphatase-like protein [Circinella umbellata]|nr:protein-tyrosine phosphatase-like protein [Circinella umbellata]